MDSSNRKMPSSATKREAKATLAPLILTSINDVPDNPRLGLGYFQLSDPEHPVPLIARLPEVTRNGDTVELFWDEDMTQTYDLTQAIRDYGMLSFSVPTELIKAPAGTVYYTLYDHEADHLQKSEPRKINVNRNVPGGLDEDTSTGINERLEVATVSPALINDPDTPVTVIVQPWLNMELYDQLWILWNGIRIAASPVVMPGTQQVINIPSWVLEEGGSSEKLLVTYEIRDIVDNYSRVSPPAVVNVNIDPDALPAPRLLDAIGDKIDLVSLGAEGARVGVLTWPLSVSDEVQVEWVGRTPNAETQGTLPSQTVTDPGWVDLTFHIPNANLLEIAGGSLTASYRVGNRYSKSANATIIGQIVQLAALELEGAVNDTIDLAVVIQDPVTVSAPAYLGQKTGDRISIIWSGTTATGTPINYTFEYTVPEGGEDDDIVFNVPRNNLEPLGGGKLLLSWQVVPAGSSNTVTSPITTYNVTAAVLVLDPPIIKDAVGGRLNPMNAQTGTLFIAGYKGMRITDTIVPIWNGIFDTIPWALGDPSGAIESSVPPHMVAAVIGKTIDVTYEVLRDGEGKLSEVLKLTVEAIPPESLPTPQIEGVSGDILDVGALTAEPELTVAAWPFIAPGQIMWMVLRGSSTEPLDSWTRYEIKSANAQSTTIPLDYLKKLTDGSVLDLVLEVSFDGGAARQIFPIKSYTVITKPAEIVPAITSAFGADGIQIFNENETTETRGTLSGVATQNYKVKLFDNGAELKILDTDEAGNWSTSWGEYTANSHHKFHAQTIADGLQSNTIAFTIIPYLTRDSTDFEDGTFNGWLFGPTVSDYPGDREIVTGSNGYRYWANYTVTDRSAQGTALYKLYSNLQPQATYKFEMSVIRMPHDRPHNASLWLSTSSGRNTSPVSVTSNWQRLSLTFVAPGKYMQLSLNNQTAGWDGNDYGVDSILVEKISG